MDQFTPEDLIYAYRFELQRIYDKEYVQATVLEYRKGWFYFHQPLRKGKKFIFNPISKPIRKGELIRMIEELKGKW